MTRLYRALDHTAQTENDGEYVGGEVSGTSRDPFREVVHRPRRRHEGAAEAPSFSFTPPSTERRVATVRCPACGARQRPGAGWTKWVLNLLRVKPYRCDFCRHRFSETEAHRTADPSGPRDDRAVFSTFLKPADSREFRDVIRDIARDEDEQAISERQSQQQNDRDLAPWRPANIVSSRTRPHVVSAAQRLASHHDRSPGSDE